MHVSRYVYILMESRVQFMKFICTRDAMDNCHKLIGQFFFYFLILVSVERTFIFLI